MILVDRDIKELVSKGTLIVEHYDEKHVNSISYDISIDYVVGHEDEEMVILKPNHFIMIKTLEKIDVPIFLLARVEEKNSLLRMGLIVNGPCYQPGHETYCYLRVHNISEESIKINKGFVIAQLVFEELTGIPEVTYDKQKNASFQKEITYREYGYYQDIYNQLKEK
ncbi:MAG: hypothetical protein HFH08_03750 [Bacilli bacterium]|nr:hypothetical protein [Bacilli bacterium]